MNWRRNLLCYALVALVPYPSAGQSRDNDFGDVVVALSKQIERVGKYNWPFPGEYGIKIGNTTLVHQYGFERRPHWQFLRNSEFRSLSIAIEVQREETRYLDYFNSDYPDTKIGDLDSFTCFNWENAKKLHLKKGDPGFEKAEMEYRALVRRYLNILSQMPSAKK